MARPLIKGAVTDINATKLAQGFVAGDTIAEKALTKIIVDKLSGKYIIWDKKALRIKNTKRALGAPAQRTDYDYELGSYTMPDGRSSEFFVDDREDKQTQGVQNLNLPKQKLFLKQAEMAMEKEKEVADLITTPGNHTTNFPVALAWSNITAKIFDDVMAMKKAQADLTGVEPDVVIVTRDVYYAFLKNTQLQSFFLNTTGGAAAAIGLTEIAKLFGVKEVLIGTATYTNDADVRTSIWGTGLFVMLKAGNDQGGGIVDPSALPAAWGWLLQESGYPKVVKYRDERARSTVGAVDDNWLVLSTSADSSVIGTGVI